MTELITRRRIEVYSAGCATCRETVDLVQRLAAERSQEVHVLDMQQDDIARRAKDLGIRAVPAVVVTTSRITSGPEEADLRAALEGHD